MAAAIFAFVISLGEFSATMFLTRPEYPTIPMVIYRYLSRPGSLNYGQAMALSTILMLTTFVGMMAIERLRIGEGEPSVLFVRRYPRRLQATHLFTPRGA